MSTSKSATNKTNTSGKSSDNGDRKGPPAFIQYRLTEDELVQAKNAADNYFDVGEIIAQFIEEGYKFSASHDSYGGGTQCFVTPSSSENINFGFTLSARAPNLLSAVAVLCWKHYTLFGKDWPKGEVSQKGQGWG